MQDKKQQLELDIEKWTGSKLGEEYDKAVFYHPAFYIMRNARLDDSQAGIKIVGRTIIKLRYADDTTLMQKAKRNQTA